jgi:hypothetical protein
VGFEQSSISIGRPVSRPPPASPARHRWYEQQERQPGMVLEVAEEALARAAAFGPAGYTRIAR